jgi:hypothetical protein
MIGSTYTYALLEISQAAYDEIKAKLESAGYSDQFHEDDGQIAIDMHGIAVVPIVAAQDFDSADFPFVHTFGSSGADFSAYAAACRWLAAQGFSYGSMQAHAPTAIFKGAGAVSKWRNLSDQDRAAIAGVITADANGFRQGIVSVRFRREP